jgi:hypothetical protein
MSKNRYRGVISGMVQMDEDGPYFLLKQEGSPHEKDDGR